jgi:hypothetical protein
MYLSVIRELRTRAIEHVEKRRTSAWYRTDFKFWNVKGVEALAESQRMKHITVIKYKIANFKQKQQNI